MVTEKTIPLHELKYYYGEHLGFVFHGVAPSSDDAIHRLANTLLNCKVSEKLPEFYTRVDPKTVAFVYAGDSGFRSAEFYQASRRVSRLGLFEIDTLAMWLRTH